MDGGGKCVSPLRRCVCADTPDVTGEAGTVEIESEWTARKREAKAGRLLCVPPFARKEAKDGAPTFEEG
jgi:hypothetical protein